MAEIVHFMQKRQYQKANDAYLRLSIGNAPWPIGVTMVGYVFFRLSFTMVSSFMNATTVSTSDLRVKRYLRIRSRMC